MLKLMLNLFKKQQPWLRVYGLNRIYRKQFSWSVIGLFGLFSCDPRFMAHIDLPWFVKFSKMANINFRESWFGFFFINWDLWPETETPPFKVFVYWKGVLNTFL